MDISPNQATLDPAMAESADDASRESRYREAIKLYAPALARLARGYESQTDRQEDLLQDIHVALWRSLAGFDNRCSLRTWVYRVAHITATKHIVSNRRVRLQELHTLDEVIEHPDDEHDQVNAADRDDALQHLLRTIERLKPLDRQVILLYLEDFSAEAIGEVVGLSAANVATKIHRIKKLLTQMFHARGKS